MYHPGDALSRADRPPWHYRAVQAGEEIARKQRPHNHFAPARVADPDATPRQIGLIALAQQIRQRLTLRVRAGVDRVPRYHGAASTSVGSAIGLSEMPKSFGATRRHGAKPSSA